MASPPIPQLEAHEDRIQRAEATVQDLAVGLARCTADVASLQRTVDEGFSSINTKLDSFVEANATITKQVESLARIEAVRTERSAVMKKLLWVLVSAAGGMVAEKLLHILHVI